MVDDDFKTHEQSYKQGAKFIEIDLKTNLTNALNDFLIELLTKTDLEEILVPQELPGGQNNVQTLVPGPVGLQRGNIIAPVMPVNSAKLVSDITRLTPSPKKLAVVLKPCEHRALIELVKLKQASLDNIIVIGVECPGTFAVTDYAEVVSEGKSTPTELILKHLQDKDYIDQDLTAPALRTACQVCEFFTPENVDITINMFGIDLNKTAVISINTPSAQQLAGQTDLKFTDNYRAQKSHDEFVEKLAENRLKKIEELLEATQDEVHGLENLSNFFSKCINCHNCMTVCPICYCLECFFESSTFNYESDKYFKWSDRKGTLKMPIDMLLFHLGRFNHMVLSCVACGMCEQGCPSGIPLLKIYKTVGLNAQKVFDYVPGRNIEEPIPVLTFQEDELEPR